MAPMLDKVCQALLPVRCVLCADAVQKRLKLIPAGAGSLNSEHRVIEGAVDPAEGRKNKGIDHIPGGDGNLVVEGEGNLTLLRIILRPIKDRQEGREGFQLRLRPVPAGLLQNAALAGFSQVDNRIQKIRP